ncbi:DUF1905 domain-containing protein [Microbacterium sp.]|uniref:DUF1905 domain-containing protein n=1 Tax=Microbacterium sp. TaxID=51671 RepID=UPI003F70D36D
MPLDHSFITILLGDMGPHRWTCAILDDSTAILGTGKAVKVQALIDGVAVTTSLLPYRGRHLLPVKQAILDAIDKKPGDTVTVSLRDAEVSTRA